LTVQTLEVWCFEQRAGVLADRAGGLDFQYDTAWLDGTRPPLSQSLPLDGSFDSEAVVAYFGGLLPEGRPRRQLARQLGISAGNDFAFLDRLAGDTAGAVSLVRPGEGPPYARSSFDVEWLEDRGLAEVIREIPSRPMHADPDGEYRLSLAGAQDKLPVVVGRDGRIGLTKGGTPSTHIVKTPIDRLPDTVVNEAFCLALGRRLGIDTVEAEARTVSGLEFLLVTRYDRRGVVPDVERLHQEDFCQALGVPAERKYQSEGGPGLADCFDLIRAATTVPARDTIRLLDYIGLNFLVGNHDAHGKNYSLLYRPEGPGASLAPAYDVMSTFVYRDVQNVTRKMAMKIGTEYRPDWVRARHVDAMLEGAGLGIPPSRRRLRSLARQAVPAADAVRVDLRAVGWTARLLDQIVELIRTRSELLEAATSSRSAQSASAR
jgi:serine/threonine-protein kinase HipA